MKAAPNLPLLGEVCYGMNFENEKENDLRSKKIDLSYVIDTYRIFAKRGQGENFFRKSVMFLENLRIYK